MPSAPGRRRVLTTPWRRPRSSAPTRVPTPLRDTMSELLGMDEPRMRVAAMMSGLVVHYDLGEGHPLLGRRMPDLDLVTANGPLRVFTPTRLICEGPSSYSGVLPSVVPQRVRRPAHDHYWPRRPSIRSRSKST
jgi:hypothetical protein